MENQLEKLKQMKTSIETRPNQDSLPVQIIDISYYGTIVIDQEPKIKEEIYLVESKIDGKVYYEIHTKEGKIASITDDGIVQMEGKYEDKINSVQLLQQLTGVFPISLNRLEERMQKRENKKETKASDKPERYDRSSVEEKDKTKKDNAKDIEIDLDKRITKTKTFRELVPETKEKNIVQVKIRRTGMTKFEFYGINKEAEQVKLESLKVTEGTNPNKEITEVNADGEEVKKNKVYTMVSIENGTNDPNKNEGFTVDLADEMATPEVSYYRRAKDNNEYISVPVNLKTTNQKRTEEVVKEFAEKKTNPRIEDNVQKADKILEEQEETTLENIDDDPYNNQIDSREEYVQKLKQEACKRCKISMEGLEEAMHQVENDKDSIEEQIEKAEDLINEQTIGGREL